MISRSDIGGAADPARQRVVLVDEHDRAIGSADKLEAHRDPRLHRAFSVFVFDRAGRVLMQRRAAGKYHSAGLWSNTCCSHPQPGEPVAAAALDRLAFEMGLRLDALTPVGSVRYALALGGDLAEHEYDHLFCAVSDATPVPAPDEVQDWRWQDWPALVADLAARPEAYSAWLAVIIQRRRAALETFRGAHCPAAGAATTGGAPA